MKNEWNDRGFVYLIKCGKLYKVGSAVDVARRIKELTTGSAYPLQLKHSVQSLEFRKLETWIHVKLKPWRARGEWFELPIDLRRWFMSKNGAQLDRLMAIDQICDKCNAHIFSLCHCQSYPQPKVIIPFERVQQWSRKGELLERCNHCGRWFQSRAIEIYCKECRLNGEQLDLLGLLPDSVNRPMGNTKPVNWQYWQKPKYVLRDDELSF